MKKLVCLKSMQKCILFVPHLGVKGCKMHPYIQVSGHSKTTHNEANNNHIDTFAFVRLRTD